MDVTNDYVKRSGLRFWRQCEPTAPSLFSEGFCAHFLSRDQHKIFATHLTFWKAIIILKWCFCCSNRRNLLNSLLISVETNVKDKYTPLTSLWGKCWSWELYRRRNPSGFYRSTKLRKVILSSLGKSSSLASLQSKSYLEFCSC